MILTLLHSLDCTKMRKQDVTYKSSTIYNNKNLALYSTFLFFVTNTLLDSIFHIKTASLHLLLDFLYFMLENKYSDVSLNPFIY